MVERVVVVAEIVKGERVIGLVVLIFHYLRAGHRKTLIRVRASVPRHFVG